MEIWQKPAEFAKTTIKSPASCICIANVNESVSERRRNLRLFCLNNGILVLSLTAKQNTLDMSKFNRRNFLKTTGLGLLPAALPLMPSLATAHEKTEAVPPNQPVIKLFGDGEMFEPTAYLTELQKANEVVPIVKDRYGVGGVVEALEKKFCELTGKESAIFMPSGTMANQLAIAVLSGNQTKVFVQDTSHVYRDEADAAQSVFGKRLIPLAKDQAYFTVQQLEDVIDGLKNDEVFESGIGAVSIENPVRRADGKVVPLAEIERISSYCKKRGIKLHLDGARLFMAAAWTGVSIKTYAAHFDTVYISLYKYLGASAGAMLCGTKEVIQQMTHLIKIHGGTMYGSWTNAAMALAKLEGFEDRLKGAIKSAETIFAAVNKIPGFEIKALAGGTNIYQLQLPPQFDGKKFRERLSKEFNIRMAMPDEKNSLQIYVNETLLYQPSSYVINAFKKLAIA